MGDYTIKIHKCPDCGNEMKLADKRLNPFTGKHEQIVQCKQCRRWMFND